MYAEVQREILTQLPEWFDESHLAPLFLAPHIAVCLLQPRAFAELAEQLQHRLLMYTFGKVKAHSPLLGELYVDITERDVADRGITALTFMNRSHLEEPQERICLGHLRFGFCSFTSGTTSGRPLVICRSQEEQAYLLQFFPVLHRCVAGNKVEPSSGGLMLAVSTWYHGMQLQVPGQTRAIPVALNDEVDFSHVAKILERVFVINGQRRRITAISGITQRIVQLTAYLNYSGRKDLAEPVREIQVTGRQLSPREQCDLEQFWDCQVRSIFSLTELFSSGRYCKNCDAYHFDPYALVEVVDYHAYTPIRTGRGRLTLTGLFPFNQMTPVMRYLSDDLVEVCETECRHGSRAFRALGRTTQALDLEPELGRSAFLSAVEVANALEVFDQISRGTDISPVPTIVKNVGTIPSFRLHRTHDQVAHCTIQIRDFQNSSPRGTSELRKQIEERLKTFCPLIKPVIEGKRLSIDFRPGQAEKMPQA